MKILFCGGGTAGHVSPALAIAEAIKDKYPKSQIAFVGRKDGKENQATKNAGYPIYEIKVSGLKRSLSLENFKVLKDALDAKHSAKDILLEFKPDAVIGTGGYVCWPVLTAAHTLRIPTVIHESNAVLGLTSKLLAKKCNLIFLGQNIQTRYKNAYFTGNPLPKTFGKLSKKEAKRRLGIPDGKKLILSVGGSIGAKKLNDTCTKAMASFSLGKSDIYHIHSAGHRYYDEIKSAYPSMCEKNKRCVILPFIDDMATALSAADVVISRCGAMTLAEIARVGVPSILVPSPNVTGDHQRKNAEHYENCGASFVIEERELSSERLTEKLVCILENNSLIKKMSVAALKLSEPLATDKILELLESKILLAE